LTQTTGRPEQRAVLVGLCLPKDPASSEAPLSELRRLAETAGARVVGELVQRRPRRDPAYFVGRGKAQEVADLVRDTQADLVLFDNDLSPAQGRNLEQLVGCRVVDRSQLILDIFAARAHTRQAALQVELAQLEYQRSRLKRMWGHLERLEGAIGTRGPGEKQLEEDRRLVGKRIQLLKRSLEVVARQQRTQSAARKPYFKVSLVGYTNAGKSTLLRALTRRDALVKDKMFATLDPASRRLRFPRDQEVIVTDTVGFIRDLPRDLVAAFRATLEELREADLFLHVVDASSEERERRMAAVHGVLDELGLGETPELLVFNKVDRLAAGDGHPLAARYGAVAVSAIERTGLTELVAWAQSLLESARREDAMDLDGLSVAEGSGR
jgi:GTPase